MISKSIVSAVVLTASQTVLAETLFDKCSDRIGNPSYQPLNNYLLEKKISADHCQRLNNHEFIYTTGTNFYVCTFRSEAESCTEDRTGYWYPNLGVVARFSGANEKRFVLFSNSRLSHGVYGSGYHVFFFTPKTENPRGYKIISLKDVGEHNGSYSDAGDVCSNLNSESQAVEFIDKEKHYEIVNEGKSNVGIRFAQKITSCETKLTTPQILEYTWTGNDFVQSKNPSQ